MSVGEEIMSIKALAKVGIIMGCALIGTFAVFLIIPIILNIFIDKYTPQIVGQINKATGLSAGIEEIKIVTTPKLTAGLKVKKFELYTPQKEPVVIADNFQIKMSLLPILSKNIRIDVIKLDNADITLKINKDGSFAIQEYLPVSEGDKNETESVAEPFVLPFGLKLSNHLPDIHAGGYKVNFTDGKDNYILYGGKTDITNFVFNKNVKIKTSGKLVLKDKEQFNFNVNIFNKIMPDVELNDLVFNPTLEEKSKQEGEQINITEILEGLYEYKVTANADIDLKTAKESIDGKVDITNVSVIDLTPSNANLTFKNNTISILSNLYTAPNEVSKINGNITTGKNPYINLTLKTGLELANALNIIKKTALIFKINDLQTLSANGRINADFNIKSDTKSVYSSGYLKIPNAKMYYGIYNIGVDDINADVVFDNNNINIKNVSFSVLNHPLKLFGTINDKAVSDLHLTADKLNLKGLLVAMGQAAIMKENPITSGNVSLDCVIKGSLSKINPEIKLDIADVDLKNIPSDIVLKAPHTEVNIVSDGQTFSGKAKSSEIKLINPALTVSIPDLNANIGEKEIEITQTAVNIDKNKTNISGKITDYLTEKIGLDFVSAGDIQSVLKGDINTAKQTLNLVYATTNLSTIVIPMFDKSKLSFSGKVGITGNITNPILSGNVTIPTISIPEIPVNMDKTELRLKGSILHGSGTVKEFLSGKIKAENLSGDFELKGSDFYLNKLKGDSFNGKISGDIVYNLSNAKTKIDFSGSDMNAQKAIEGAAGIKNALTGTLGFNAKLNLTVFPNYNDMLKSVKGDVDFNIKNGAFGSIGRFEGLLNADNIISNVIFKNTIASISNATGLATTGQFDSVNGNLSLADGWANLHSIKSAGKTLCYYVKGKFNLINMTTNVTVWGRLDAPIVAKLGVIGELSAEKVLSYIPKIGSLTAKVLNVITTNPAGEPVSEIPALTNGSQIYKDFKVVFNGGIDSKNSVKSFKWLTNPDLSEMESKTVKESIEDIKSSFNNDIQTTVDSVTNTIKVQQDAYNSTKEQIKNSTEEIKNLFKSFKQNSNEIQTKNQAEINSEAGTENKTETKTEVKQDKNNTSAEENKSSSESDKSDKVTEPTVSQQKDEKIEENSSSVTEVAQ